jgi:hypothetical protein
VPSLQRQRVKWVLNAQVLERATGFGPASSDQVTNCLQVPALAPGHRQGQRTPVRLARGADAGRLGAQQVKVGVKQMSHGHLGAGLESGINTRHRVADEAAQLVLRCFQLLQRGWHAAADHVAGGVL